MMRNSNGVKKLKVRWNGDCANHGDAIQKVGTPGDAIIIIRGRPRSLVLRCPCGCGEIITANLDIRAGKAWSLYKKNEGISLYPSIWRDSGCNSHFIIWRDRILWMDTDWKWLDETRLIWQDKVYQLIDAIIWTHFSTISDSLDAVPWEILNVCRNLTQEGRIIEGRGKLKGHFRRPS